MIYDETPCKLGEGPLWHPERKELFWFDILSKRLHRKDQYWQFEEHVSAAGWLDTEKLLIASETRLFVYDLKTGAQDDICPLEQEQPLTRSNDGRADSHGGFWIGTMGKNAEPNLGAIYRYYKGELRRLFAPITISNAICFTPDGGHAYFADTPTGKVMRVALDPDGWPADEPDVFIDLAEHGFKPDGAITDANGTLWMAQWGASRVAGYMSDGTHHKDFAFPASQISCPALAPGMLYATSASVGLNGREEHAGKTFAEKTDAPFKPESQVLL